MSSLTVRPSRLAIAATAGLLAVGALLTSMTVSSHRAGHGATASSDPEGANAQPNAALSRVVNPSAARGGTLRLAKAGDWDSLDPANTYYAYSWNFARLYGRSLTMFAPAPGAKGNVLVPDLAATLGEPSADAKTWTYRLRSGVFFEDGTPVTSADVKYAVERSLDKTVFPNGPSYFNDLLALGHYAGPYTAAAGQVDPAIDTPDARTIVFHLKVPFAGFDYLAQLPATMPVPAARDTGTAYAHHVISTGPYRFQTLTAGQGFELDRNLHWDRATDPHRTALPNRISVQVNVDATDLDNRLLAGDVDVDVTGAGLQAAAQARVLRDPALRADTDLATTTGISYTAINGDVAPLDNIACRRAIEYAADRGSYQRAFGGPTGGRIATNILPPVIPGAAPFDLYPRDPRTPDGADLPAARQQLSTCGHPRGFSTNIAYRADVPKEKAAAEALQQSLAKAGITLHLRGYPSGDYYALYAGRPDYARRNNIGLMQTGWAADWPDGYGMLTQILDSRTIRTAGGNANLSVKDPAIDTAIDTAVADLNPTRRQHRWTAIDRAAMTDAYILPGIWNAALLYRSPRLTNVVVTDAYGMYDYLTLGVKRSVEP